MASSRAKTRSTQSQTCIKYCGIIFLLREIQMSTQVIWKYFTKQCQNKVDFPDIIFNFSNMECVLPSTLCMTGELWPRRFIWHQDIRVNHCQSTAMSFIFTQYSFCNGSHKKKSRIRETPTLSTDEDSRTDAILERLRNTLFVTHLDTAS